MGRGGGPLHRAASVCEGNRVEYAARHERLGGRHVHYHRFIVLAHAPALAADALANDVARDNPGCDAGSGWTRFGNHQRGEHGICRGTARPGGGLCRGPLPGGISASAIDSARDTAGHRAKYSLGGHHHDERFPGFEPGRIARAGATGLAGGHRGRPSCARHGDDLFAAFVSRAAGAACRLSSSPLADLFCAGARSRRGAGRPGPQRGRKRADTRSHSCVVRPIGRAAGRDGPRSACFCSFRADRSMRGTLSSPSWVGQVWQRIAAATHRGGVRAGGDHIRNGPSAGPALAHYLWPRGERSL